MSTLAKSGHLFELHRYYGGLRMGVRFYEIRHRQLRRAIRRQRIVLFLLSSRAELALSLSNGRDLLLCLRPWRAVAIPQPDKVIHRVLPSGKVESVSASPFPKSIAIKRRKPQQFSILTISGERWIVLSSHRFVFWYVVELAKQLN